MNLIVRNPEIHNYSNCHWARRQVKALVLVKNTRTVGLIIDQTNLLSKQNKTKHKNLSKRKDEVLNVITLTSFLNERHR